MDHAQIPLCQVASAALPDQHACHWCQMRRTRWRFQCTTCFTCRATLLLSTSHLHLSLRVGALATSADSHVS